METAAFWLQPATRNVASAISVMYRLDHSVIERGCLNKVYSVRLTNSLAVKPYTFQTEKRLSISLYLVGLIKDMLFNMLHQPCWMFSC